MDIPGRDGIDGRLTGRRNIQGAVSMKRVRKAVLPVAGFGTRVLPATKAVPKEMLPVFDRPAVHWVVDEALAAGIEHFVFVTGRNKGAIEDYFDRASELEDSLKRAGKTAQIELLESILPPAGSASFVRQQSPLGLGHAVWCARDIVGDEPFAVLLPDVLVRAEPSCLAQMMKAYDKVGGNVIAVDAVPMERVSSYGVIAHGPRDGDMMPVTGMVEKPKQAEAPSNLKITGRYILQPEIFTLLATQERGAGGEIQLTDAMLRLIGAQPFTAVEFKGREFDCGSHIGYAEAFLGHALKDPAMGAEVRAMVERLLAKG
jgi:UTP--glucose-1-phosphate uridylyltransferase